MLKKVNLKDLSKLETKIDADTIHRYNFPKLVKKSIQELQGLSTAIIYDGKIDDSEIELINSWLYKHEEYLTEYPLYDLNILFKDIFADKVITTDERKKLFDFLNSIAAAPSSEAVVEGIFEENPEIIFNSKYFLFTGKLVLGSRSKAQEKVLELGGFCQKGLNLQTDYLVVGDLGSEDYKYSRFGSKIEGAIKYNREKNTNILIVKEKDFVNSAIGQ
ncbi:MAG: BRCT domain-containing protein [Ignavibacterium sp.]|nr:BRCT domain-containing protein [Ignavibacterium sp.]